MTTHRLAPRCRCCADPSPSSPAERERRALLGLLALTALAPLAACGERPSGAASVAPVEITRSTSCELDGMLLMDYPGPKGQIHFAGADKPAFYCDTVEVLNTLLLPEQVRKVDAVYVQDMGKTDWDNPQGAWIDARSGLAPDAPRPVPADARCPVCGMFPARQPLWAGQAVYRDGAAHFFDSPVDLMQFLTAVERYSAGRSAADVHTSWVTDAAGRGWVELTKAWFVHGSDALGPMRRGDLPAFADEAGAAEFASRRGGRVLTFEAVTPAILKSLAVERGAGLHEHAHAS